MMAYKDLQEQLGRNPAKKEWESLCRDRSVSVRFQKDSPNPHVMAGYREFESLAQGYNHRVKYVREVETLEDVYNITVDNNHTVCVATSITERSFSGIATFQCGEIPLEDREACNLVENFPAHHDTFEDYQRTLKFAYLYAKTVTLIPTHDPRTNAVAMRNRRIGCSQSGITQALKKLGRYQYLRWCDDGYRYMATLDKVYSEWLCIPRSIKMATVKPSGTISLLVGATPGQHYPHSEFYIRNVRVQDTSPLVQACRDAQYTVEEDTYAPDTVVISFPVREQNFDRAKRDVSIWEQFANVSDLQREWADNQVSATVTFQAHEVEDIQRCLETYETKLKGVSLLPLEDHGYEQAPYIEIDEETYNEMVAALKPLDLSDSVHEVTEKFCTNDSCEIVPPKPEN